MASVCTAQIRSMSNGILSNRLPSQVQQLEGTNVPIDARNAAVDFSVFVHNLGLQDEFFAMVVAISAEYSGIELAANPMDPGPAEFFLPALFQVTPAIQPFQQASPFWNVFLPGRSPGEIPVSIETRWRFPIGPDLVPGDQVVRSFNIAAAIMPAPAVTPFAFDDTVWIDNFFELQLVVTGEIVEIGPPLAIDEL